MIFFIVGPTASGKTALAVEAAQEIGAEIVSADAFQIYRGLDLLTAKPDGAEQRKVKHHLLSVVALDETMSAAKFRELARAALVDIRARKKTALIVGGSGLYLKVLTHGLAKNPPPNEELRRELNALPVSELAARLQKMNPDLAARTDLKNPRRIIRAIEITVIPSEAEGSRGSYLEGFAAGSLGFARDDGVLLLRDRHDLYRRIDARVNEMFRAGVEDEVRELQQVGPTAVSALGLGEIRELLAGKISRLDCIAKIQQATRRYAKRQLTWFRHQTNFRQLNLTTLSQAEAVSAILQQFARE